MTPLPSLRQLRYLLALHQHRHFGRAAEACFVTQSSLSAAIQELEQIIGVSLVERSRRHVLFTPLGEQIVERTGRILREVEDLVEHAQAGREPLTGALRLGVIPTIGPYVLPDLMPRLRRAFPRLQLYLREDQTAPLIDRLNAGELDLVLLALPYETEALETLDLARDGLVVACPAGHPFAAQDGVSPDQLADQPLLLLEDGHCLRHHALELCHLTGPGRNEVFQGTSLRTLVQMAAAGVGITLVPKIAETIELRNVPGLVFRDLVTTAPSRTIALAWRRTSARRAEFQQLGQLIAAGLPPLTP
ncbi:MAG: LysR substrate-binding domain-containing protein [Azospirillaceae bacterium]|nr:LysR substrate-binding domain-containing protein [Azospirillaceae bacterium]